MKKIFEWIINKLKSFKDFAIVPYNPSEGIVGFVLRQVLIPDSSGQPSWTVTITSYVLALTAMVSKYEFDMYKTIVQKFDPNTGKVVWQGIRGFDSEYWALLGTLSIAVTYLFRQRVKDKNETTSLTETPMEEVKQI